MNSSDRYAMAVLKDNIVVGSCHGFCLCFYWKMVQLIVCKPEPIMLLKLPIMLLSNAPNFSLLCPNYAPLCPIMLHYAP